MRGARAAPDSYMGFISISISSWTSWNDFDQFPFPLLLFSRIPGIIDFPIKGIKKMHSPLNHPTASREKQGPRHPIFFQPFDLRSCGCDRLERLLVWNGFLGFCLASRASPLFFCFSSESHQKNIYALQLQLSGASPPLLLSLSFSHLSRSFSRRRWSGGDFGTRRSAGGRPSNGAARLGSAGGPPPRLPPCVASSR